MLFGVDVSPFSFFFVCRGGDGGVVNTFETLADRARITYVS